MNITIRKDVEIINGKASFLTVTKITGFQVIFVRGIPVEVESVTISDGWGCCPIDYTRARKNLTPEGQAEIARRTGEIAGRGMVEQGFC